MIQKQILDMRRKIRDLANEYGATMLDPLQEQEMAHINADPMVEKLSSTIVQMELDLIAAQAQQTNLPANPDGAPRVAVRNAFKQKLEERRLALAKRFDSSLHNRLREAARQRLIQVKARCEVEDPLQDPTPCLLQSFATTRQTLPGSRHLSLLGQVQTHYKKKQTGETIVETTYFWEKLRQEPTHGQKPHGLGAVVVLSTVPLILRRASSS